MEKQKRKQENEVQEMRVKMTGIGREISKRSKRSTLFGMLKSQKEARKVKGFLLKWERPKYV